MKNSRKTRHQHRRHARQQDKRRGKTPHPARRSRPGGDSAQQVADDESEDRGRQQQAIVQGSASVISSDTVLGNLFSETPKSKRARLAI